MTRPANTEQITATATKEKPAHAGNGLSNRIWNGCHFEKVKAAWDVYSMVSYFSRLLGHSTLFLCRYDHSDH